MTENKDRTTATMAHMTGQQMQISMCVMRAHGGAFVKSMANAMTAADPSNRLRLVHAFPEILLCYGPGSAPYKEFSEIKI